MAFYIPRVHRTAPETVFTIVFNSNTEPLSVGHGAFWYNVFSASGGTAGTNDLYQVTHGGTDTVHFPRPGMFAGVVAGRDISPSDFGSIQVWGRNEFVLVMGTTHTTAPFVTVGGTDSTNWTNKVLRPLGIFGNGTGEGAATNLQYFGIVPLPTASASWSQNLQGPYLIPLDGCYTQNGPADVGTALVSISHGSVRAIKAFIRAL